MDVRLCRTRSSEMSTDICFLTRRPSPGSLCVRSSIAFSRVRDVIESGSRPRHHEKRQRKFAHVLNNGLTNTMQRVNHPVYTYDALGRSVNYTPSGATNDVVAEHVLLDPRIPEPRSLIAGGLKPVPIIPDVAPKQPTETIVF